jgi:hypothetical protein
MKNDMSPSDSTPVSKKGGSVEAPESEPGQSGSYREEPTPESGQSETSPSAASVKDSDGK